MKIAVPTDDGTTVSAHFGHARFYLIASIDDGTVLQREMRKRPETHKHHDHGEKQDIQLVDSHENDSKGCDKFQLLEDCDVLFAGGMGEHAFQRVQSMGIKIVLTDHKSIENVLNDAVAGIFVNNPKRVHAHHHSS